MRDAERAQLACELLAVGRRVARRSARRSLRLRVSTRSCLPDLRVDEPEVADVRQLLLARVADLDRDDVVARRELEQRGRQSRGPRKSETTTITARAAGEPAEAAERGRRARSARWARDRALAAARAGAARRPRLPCRAGEVTGFGRRTWRRARRLPRRTAKLPTASETPSATSHFRRSAVPNVIDADVSSSSHVSTARSATLTRTCGSPVRAVTFQSIRRTSSPGAYGRTCASSVPSPVAHERWSPASRPSIAAARSG